MTDVGVKRFDITAAQPADMSRVITNRPVGGLGIHLVKQIMDEIAYEYDERNRRSTITLIKHLRS
jgi:anti-sigma regulatory factor (Ser/Thr protein kinase)